MSKKALFLLFGWITLLVFPIPAIWALWYFEGIDIWTVLSLDELKENYWLLGLQFGFYYGILVLAFAASGFMAEEDLSQTRFIHSLKLGWSEILFMSFCAGFGEEILFRVGIQHWLGPWITSILFIAIHGYLNPFKPRTFLYGIFIIPFIIGLAFAYNYFGLWFCIAAHFSFDLLLLRVYAIEKSII
ncbi:MAG: type II CAAX prenyl endopeptidase Rce1 family protein [Lishizhenia sp.]